MSLFKTITSLLLTLLTISSLQARPVEEISLNGSWETGYNRKYTDTVQVPGLAGDPAVIDKGIRWYRRYITLPAGRWSMASLRLNGARFAPSVYVNGEKIARLSGGMAPIFVLLDHNDVKPGQTIELEIALLSLDLVDPSDASRIPEADLWRSNVSSLLWDDITLRLHGNTWLERVYPYPDFERDKALVTYQIGTGEQELTGHRLCIELLDSRKKVVISSLEQVEQLSGRLEMDLKNRIKPWSPEDPNLYRLRVTLLGTEGVLDRREMNYGHRSFEVDGLGFKLNNHPIQLRGATVVWHRWLRDPQARQLAWDEDWFRENIVKRLKELGANTLRFHLGMPPERFLDLCDKYGLMVQAEWLFFHGMKASLASLLNQWPDWFDLSLQHPSVVLLHPWNETDYQTELERGFQAIDELSDLYPPLVISHRDVTHVHKYWWSLFENLGLYYDSYKQFSQPIVVDEFGGNYLDGQARMGGYPMVPSAFMRFLGEEHTAEQRLYHQTLANVKVGEYWRRLGAAGVLPYCALGSPEDGNHWFMGPVEKGNPKPVWPALAPVFAPLSVSLEVWDRNFEPGDRVTVPVYFFNDTREDKELSVLIEITDNKYDILVRSMQVNTGVPAYSHKIKRVDIALPEAAGDWTFKAMLLNNQPDVTYPVISSWKFRTMLPRVPENLRNLRIAVPNKETELQKMLSKKNLQVTSADDPGADILVTSRKTWSEKIRSPGFIRQLEQLLDRGTDVIMLDAGPVYLGQGYYKNDLGPLQAVREVSDSPRETFRLPYGVEAVFQEVAEPESHLHPSEADCSLWEGMDREATWLWNGLRGGLIVPATGMELSGLNPAAFVAKWTNRGADGSLIKSTSYHAYELQGYYVFSRRKDDRKAIKKLREKVQFLVEDAPALKLRINPEAPVIEHDLAAGYKNSQNSRAKRITALALAGKDLVKSPVYRIHFGQGKGSLIISQLLTHRRMAKGFGEEGLYGIRYDPAAVQFVLNMLNEAGSRSK